jgi:anti-sigma28 factor (negative regulator of flagellin synthesis)
MEFNRVPSQSGDSRKTAPVKTAAPRFAPNRSRKIARIRKAIADGSYDVPAADVAGKLIEHMLER